MRVSGRVCAVLLRQRNQQELRHQGIAFRPPEAGSLPQRLTAFSAAALLSFGKRSRPLRGLTKTGRPVHPAGIEVRLNSVSRM
jgi:hypothetical protein